MPAARKRPGLALSLTLTASGTLAAVSLGQEISPFARCPVEDRPGPFVARFFPEPDLGLPPDAAPEPPSAPGKAFERGPDGEWRPIVRKPLGGGGPDAPDTMLADGAETGLAIDVSNPSNLVGCLNQGFTTTPSMMASANGNTTWATRAFPSGGGSYTSFPFDPWAASGNAAGELFAMMIRGESFSSNTRCVIARSTNGGASFASFYAATNRVVFQDRAMIDVDRTTALGGGAGTTHDGKVFLCFDDYGFNSAGYTASVLQTVSPTGTLVNETIISTSATFRGSQMQPVAGISDGQCFVMSASVAGGGLQSIATFHEVTPTGGMLSRSTITFNRTGQQLGSSGRWGVNGHRIGQGTYMDIDRTTGARRGRLYVVTNRNANPTNATLDQGDLYISYSTNAGATWTSALLPGLAAGKTQFFPMLDVDDNGFVHVAYYQNEGGVLNSATANLYYTSSTDGGSTWSAPAQLNQAVNTLDYFNPPPNLAGAAYYLIGDYNQIRVTGTGSGTTAYVLWTGYDKDRSDVSVGNKRERVICTTIPPAATTGACCVGSVCTGGVSQATCAAQGGQWYAGQACGSVSCGGGPPNNACTNPIVAAAGSTPFTTVGATTDGPPDCAVNQDVWFRYTAVCGGTIFVSINSPTYQPAIAAYAGLSCPATGLLACNATGTGFISFPTNAGGVYTIRVGGLGAATGTGTLAILAPTAPQITQHPSNASTCPGGSVMFSVVADGGTPLSYQWRFGTTNIPGATGPSYTINNVQAGNVGSYSCLVSNPCGQTPSNAATLSLASTPGITQHPPPAQSWAPGQTMVISVTATGANLTYQWRRNNVDLVEGGRFTGTRTPTLQVSPVQMQDDGSFLCVVSNACGSVSSNPTRLCYPNADLSTGTPVLNVADFVAFQSLFAAGDPRANCDGSTGVPTLNVGDFVCFQSRFAAGCP